MIKISVIIPVYKVEAYLHKCVHSVLNQNHKDIEVILVNDGSPDNCPKMCDEFRELDSRVRVIHQANGGSSSARNTGIKVATGSYILFLDSDDYWEGKDCLGNLVNTISSNKADIILYGTKDVNLNSNTEVVSRGWYNIPASSFLVFLPKAFLVGSCYFLFMWVFGLNFSEKELIMNTLKISKLKKQ